MKIMSQKNSNAVGIGWVTIAAIATGFVIGWITCSLYEDSLNEPPMEIKIDNDKYKSNRL